jgi:hypothetical protein
MNKAGQRDRRADAPVCNIIFRIPKTASTTFQNLVFREYKHQPRIDTHYTLQGPAGWQGFAERFAAMPLEQRESYRVIIGHMKFGLHEFVPGPSRYITFLRHPVDRFVSYYRMLRKLNLVRPDHAFDLSRPDWNVGAHESLAREMDNGQTRALANADWDLPFGACTEEHLAAAKANMDRSFAFVGLTERFDLSLLALARLLGWRCHFYVPANVTKAAHRQTSLPPDVLAATAKLNRLDDELYRHAEKRLTELVRSYGPSFQMERRAFDACNALHAKLHHIRRKLKQVRSKESKPVKESNSAISMA